MNGKNSEALPIRGGGIQLPRRSIPTRRDLQKQMDSATDLVKANKMKRTTNFARQELPIFA